VKRETGDLAELELDLGRYELRLAGARIALEKQPMDLLILLVEKRGELATRDEIVTRLWGERTFFDADRAINTAIRKIRLALHDDADQPRYIETVVGRGYRFVGPVRQLPIVAPEAVVTRLMVLPFRMLRSDPDVAFLAFSVPDAVAAALSGLGSLTIRSTAAALQYATEPLDFGRIAEEASVDVVLTGTILRAGETIRVNCQLIEAPAGTVRGSLQLQVSLSDLFQLQDHLVERIVESLALSLTVREHRLLKKDVPASPAAYEFYLRGNELSRRGLAGAETLGVARDLYVRGLEEDPGYAPAWARLGRCYVLIGKGVENAAENFASAESSFQRALALNPDLELAHSLYAHLEAEVGRAGDAMVRLAGRAQAGSAEPSLFAALVQCCRYCGLLEASLAAHQRAHNLDPQIATSVGHTLYQLGDYQGALRHANSGVWMLDAMALDSLGRQEEAVAILMKREQSGIPAPMRAFVRAWRALLEGHARESLEAAEETVLRYIDPEGVFYMALVMARLGETDRALAVLAASLKRGFCSYHVLARNAWFDSLRSHPRFEETLRAAEAQCRDAVKAYQDCGGARESIG
jgi:DNA-binding winged helix-turn-helix (wHTH) protein/TolB-like protein/tetratricopeptide (TPR) repeat protein